MKYSDEVISLNSLIPIEIGEDAIYFIHEVAIVEINNEAYYRLYIDNIDYSLILYTDLNKFFIKKNRIRRLGNFESHRTIPTISTDSVNAIIKHIQQLTDEILQHRYYNLS